MWATKHREPLLVGNVEKLLHKYMHQKADDLGASVYALNGSIDHIHIVVSIPPKIAVAKFVGQVKGVSSLRLNQSKPQASQFFWQEEYSAFTLDRKRLPYFVAYVQAQKEHHKENTLIPILENSEEGLLQLRELPAIYSMTNDDWWREMLES